MNDLCYKCSQDGLCLNSLNCVFVHKEVRCTTKLKQKTNCNILQGDKIIYATEEDLEMKKKHSTFSKSFYLLKQQGLLFFEKKYF